MHGRLQDAINALTPEENELDQLFNELGVTLTPPAENNDFTYTEEIERLMRALEPDQSGHETGSSSDTKDEDSGSDSSSESLPVRRVPRLPRVVADITTPPPPPQPQGNRVPCPVCGAMVLQNTINDHLDECLTMQAIN